MVKFNINGIPVEIERGKTILQAAQKLGIPILTLCYHRSLTPYGACRLCLVEIHKKGRKLIQASCQYQVEDDIDIKTETPELQKIRQIMISLHLARAPRARKIIEIAEKLGVTKSDLITQDENCVLCGLCVRMCKERMGRSAINFAMRGERRKITTPFDLKSPVCMVCGACYFICPTVSEKLKEVSARSAQPIPDEFDERLRSRPVIHIPFPQAVPNLALIDKEHCVHLLTQECRICEDFCEAQAIKFDQQEDLIKIDIGSIILAPGFDEFDARRKSEYGYGRFNNVVTSIEFERILSASGPFQGHLLRPGDKKEPKRIAFIQCVGSRDPQVGVNYCSSVCCTYAIKEAIIAKEHSKNGLEVTIFYMDIRTFGKGFESYYERARSEYGIHFVRAGVSKIEEDPQTKNLKVYYESEDGEIKQEEFDLIVLSVGLMPRVDSAQLARKLRINLNIHGFCRTSEFMPVDTMQDGIYVCGAFAGPKDIPETVTQASAAAARAMEMLAPVRHTLTVKREPPPELDVSNQETRIGVFVCHCGINIGGYVDVLAVVECIKDEANVVYVDHNLYTCSQDTQKRIIEKIKEHKLNRVVVASCTPRTHEPLFRETIREAGLNPYLFEMANIRDQCSWIHMQEPKEATEKAKDLLRMAVAKARYLKPLKRVEIEVTPKALVIGGGISGMVASLALANQGFEVFLIERDTELGGYARYINYTIEGRNIQNFLNLTIEKVRKHKLIRLFTNAEIESITGFIGNYESEIRKSDGSKERFKHGVVIVATGAQEYKPTEYFYGKNPRIITQRELEKVLDENRYKELDVIGLRRNAQPGFDITQLNSVVMIQCIGSRDEAHPYCSRICCSQAVKNGLRLLEENPNLNVYILYKDVRTYGLREDLYRRAREAGIVFIKYDNDHTPELSWTVDGRIIMSVFEPILKENIDLVPDLCILSTGIEPNQDNAILAKMLKVPLNTEGFFLEAHVKLRPVDFATEGIFVAGMAHSPKTIDESICQAMAATARAVTILANRKYFAEATVSTVNEELCAGCGICSGLCPYEAIEIVSVENRRKSRINEVLCKGCGTCVAACPAGALEQYGFTRKQIGAMLKAL